MKQQIYNPYLPSYEYIPDGEPHVFEDRLYVYGSHDRFGGEHYCENDYVCWSAPLSDLSDWRYEGVIYRKDSHPEDELHKRTFLFAPDVIKGQDGRYYLYYSMSGSSIMSVAVCDTPAGSYSYYGDVQDKTGKIVGVSEGDYYQFDPGIFRDEDGRLYLYSGFCPNKEADEKGRVFAGAHVCRLAQDMITVEEGPRIFIPRDAECPDGARFFEASSMRKINGIYYFVYSARNTGLHYFYSRYPDREFQYGGRIHSTSDVGMNGHTEEFPAYPVGNTHGGLVELNGQYYIFDHRHTNGTSYCRQGVAEPVCFDQQGRILQAEATSCGLNGGPLKGKGVYPAYIACHLFYQKNIAAEGQTARITQDGKDRECGPGQYLQGISNGCVIGYKYFGTDAPNQISLTVRGDAKGCLEAAIQEQGAAVGTARVLLDTGEWQKISIPVSMETGIYALYFRYAGEGSFDLLEFELQEF